VNSVYLVMAPLVGIYCMLLFVFPRPVLHVIGPKYAASSVTVLQLYSISAFIGYMQRVLVAALMAARQTRYIFAGSVAGCVIALVLSPVLIWKFGANGAIISMILTTLVQTVLYVLAYRKQVKEQLELVESIAANTVESV
jgi:O-antigen/teichoic acid export membrane protein